MDFLDPQKKRDHRNKLFVGYGLMAIALAIATTILVYAANGYGFNRQTGELIQNGLVFLNAQPSSANIKINGTDRGATGARLVLPEAKYSVELSRSGYQSWKHDFTLEGNQVLRLAYPRLFPQKLVQSNIRAYEAAPSFVSASPDQQWLVSHQPAAFNQFEIINLEADPIAPLTINLPETVLVSKLDNQSLAVVEWSKDNRHLLLKHTYTDGVDFIVMDRQDPALSVNLTQRYGRQFSDVKLRDMRFDRLYVYQQDGGLLQAAELGVNTLLTDVANNVLAFYPYQGDIVMYVTNETAPPGQVVVRIKSDLAEFKLRNLPGGTVYLLQIAEFDRQIYLAVGEQASGNTYIYKNPLDRLKNNQSILPQPFQLLKVSGAETVSFSNNARFLSVQGGSRFAIYDFETEQQIRYDSLLLVQPGQKATWMDGHRLLVNSQNKLFVFDFDGTNKRDLGPAIESHNPAFNQDYTGLYRLNSTVDGPTVLTRTELTTP